MDRNAVRSFMADLAKEYPFTEDPACARIFFLNQNEAPRIEHVRSGQKRHLVLTWEKGGQSFSRQMIGTVLDDIRTGENGKSVSSLSVCVSRYQKPKRLGDKKTSFDSI